MKLTPICGHTDRLHLFGDYAGRTAAHARVAQEERAAELDDELSEQVVLNGQAADVAARVVVRHTAAAPGVNVWANGSPINRGYKLVNGAQRRWNVPEGKYNAFVSLAGQSSPVIGPAGLSLKSGYSYQVYAWGNGAAGFGLIVIPLWVGEKN